jgi:hypothetical protein
MSGVMVTHLSWSLRWPIHILEVAKTAKLNCVHSVVTSFYPIYFSVQTQIYHE